MTTTKYHFLPSSNTIYSQTTTTPLVDKPMTPIKKLIAESSSSKCCDKSRRCCRKVIPAIGLCTLMTGLTLIGVTLKRIPEGHVGYYVPNEKCISDESCTVDTYTSEYYFIMPWSQGSDFRITDVRDRNLTLGIFAKSRPILFPEDSYVNSMRKRPTTSTTSTTIPTTTTTTAMTTLSSSSPETTVATYDDEDDVRNNIEDEENIFTTTNSQEEENNRRPLQPTPPQPMMMMAAAPIFGPYFNPKRTNSNTFNNFIDELSCIVRYKVRNVNKYLKTISSFKEESVFIASLIEELKRDIGNGALSPRRLPAPYKTYGISIEAMYFV